MTEIMKFISDCNTERPMSKDQACEHLNLSRAQFDVYVKNGLIPKGKKVLGFKELGWVKSDLNIVKEKLKSR